MKCRLAGGGGGALGFIRFSFNSTCFAPGPYRNHGDMIVYAVFSPGYTSKIPAGSGRVWVLGGLVEAFRRLHHDKFT